MTISGDTRNKILAYACWVEGNLYNPYLAPGASLGDLPGQIVEELSAQRLRTTLLIFKEIYSTSRTGRASPDEPHSEGSEPKAKRQATTSELPKTLERQWEILRVCNRSDIGSLFPRIKARALRELVALPAKLPARINEEIFTFLKAQDLCALSECSLEWNYETQNIPRIWEKLGRDFCLPADYWPNFSKRQCLQNLGLIHRANQAFSAYAVRHPGNSLVRLLVSLSGRNAALELRSSIRDPQRRFVDHTRALISPMLTEGKPIALNAYELGRAHPLIQKGHFLDLLNGFAIQPEEPRAFLNLVWTCGYPKNLVTLRAMLNNSLENSKIRATPRLLNAWVEALRWGATCIPLTKADQPMFGQLFERLRYSKPSEVEKFEPLLFEILKRGIGTPRMALFYHNVSANLYRALLASYQPEVADRSLSFRAILGNFLLHHMQESHYKTGEILDILKAFPTELASFDRAGENEHLLWTMPEWLYRAAKTGNRELLQTLRKLGVRFYSVCPEALPPHGLVEHNTLDIALENRAPYALIALLIQEDVARISLKSATLLERYPVSAENEQLRELLFRPNGPPAVQ